MIDALTEATAAYTGPLPRAETDRLIQAAQHGRTASIRQAAMRRLVTANIRLVLKEAAKYTGLRSAVLDRDDLIAEGLDGLRHAILRFDLRRGHTLATYAVWWIRQRISRAAAASGDLRLPIHVVESARRLRRTEAQYPPGDYPSDAELARSARVSPDALVRLRALNAIEIRSLNEPAASDVDRDLADVIPDPTEYDGQRVDRAHLLSWLVEHLPADRRGEMFLMRFGLHPDYPYPMTYTEIGHCYSLSRERVRQLIDLLLRDLKHPSRAQALNELRELLA